jgi:hypothetical protein
VLGALMQVLSAARRRTSIAQRRNSAWRQEQAPSEADRPNGAIRFAIRDDATMAGMFCPPVAS